MGDDNDHRGPTTTIGGPTTTVGGPTTIIGETTTIIGETTTIIGETTTTIGEPTMTIGGPTTIIGEPTTIIGEPTTTVGGGTPPVPPPHSPPTPLAGRGAFGYFPAVAKRTSKNAKKPGTARNKGAAAVAAPAAVDGPAAGGAGGLGVRPSALIDTRVVYCGDNLEQLKRLPDGCIDLVYIDLPFNSNRNYEVFWGETKEKRAFEDRHASTRAYIDYMRPQCVELARVLKKTGSFYYHCDWHASHYVKVIRPTGEGSKKTRAGHTGESMFADDWFPIQVKQEDRVGRPAIDQMEAVMHREDRQRGFFVAFGFSSDAEAECAAFFKKTKRVIKLITVQEILDEQHVQKM